MLLAGSIPFVDYKYIGSRVAQRNYNGLTPDVLYEPSYDNLGRITSARTYYDGGSDITRFDYTFDANSNNIARQKLDHRPSDPCNLFSYDDLDRLLSAQYGVDDSNEVFTIDDLVNRSTVNLRDTISSLLVKKIA